MIIKWNKRIAFIGAILWIGTGILTVGSIALSTIGLFINLVMGLLFIIFGIMLYLRGKSLYLFSESLVMEYKKNIFLQRFLWLELILTSGFSLLGGVILAAGMFRVFGEGYAIFG